MAAADMGMGNQQKPSLNISDIADKMKKKDIQKQVAKQLTQASGIKIKPKEVTPAALKAVESEVKPAEQKVAEIQDKGPISKLSGNDKIYLALAAALPTVIGAALGGAQGGALGAKATGDIFGGLSKSLADEKTAAAEKTAKLELAQIAAGEKAAQADLTRQDRASQNELNRQNQLAVAQIAAGTRAADLESKKAEASKPKDAQLAAAGFARRLEQSENIFKDLESKGFDRTSKLAGVQSMSAIDSLKPDDLISQEQAERNFVNAVLRRESGAAISPSEFGNAEKQYFPRAGDPPEVVAQKAANRAQVMEMLKASAGANALEAVPLVTIPKAAAAGIPDFDAMSDEELKKYLGK